MALPDLSALSNATTTAATLSNLVLVSPQKVKGYQPNLTSFVGPLQSPPPALLFHYEAENQLELTSDVTDHYVEDNTAIQDQVALKPEIITVRGYVGELNNVAPYGLQTFKAIADKLTGIAGYTPGLSVTALVAYNTAFSLYQTAALAANSAVSTWNTLSNIGGGNAGGENVIGSDGLGSAFNAQTGVVGNSQNQQQTALQQFYGYWRQRALFTVQTPWAVLQNMVIQSLKAVQDADTNVISEFLVTFKMIRMASTAFAPNTGDQGRRQAQTAGTTDLGTSTPTNSASLSTAVTKMGG